MSKHMVIWNQNSKNEDTIEVYSQDPSYVVLLQRSDLIMLRNIDQSSLPGIYILCDDQNRRYIGQASISVLQRLLQHEKNKSWWNNVIFFGRDDGQLDKSQLDFLERKIIKVYDEAGFDLDNGDNGNTSFIAPYQRGKAESLWENTLQILEDSAKIQVFKKSRLKKSVVNVASVEVDNLNNLSSKKSNLYSLSDSLGNNVESSKIRHVYINWMKILLEDELYKEKFYEMLNNGSAIFRSEEIYSGRVKQTVCLLDDLHLIVNLSARDIRQRIKKIAGIIGITVEISE